MLLSTLGGSPASDKAGRAYIHRVTGWCHVLHTPINKLRSKHGTVTTLWVLPCYTPVGSKLAVNCLCLHNYTHPTAIIIVQVAVCRRRAVVGILPSRSETPYSTQWSAASWISAAQYNSHTICFTLALLLLVLLAVWCSGNALVSINAVALHRARLVLGWVTAFGQVNCLIT